MNPSLKGPAFKRVYDAPDPTDGTRILVDRIWPRGLTKQRADVHLWLKDIAPSSELRAWFGHKPERWSEFRKRYLEELVANPDEVGRLRNLISQEHVTLLFAARDTEHNNAVVLAEYMTQPHSAEH